MTNIITQEEKDRIDALCQEYDIENYSINSDGTLDVDGNVFICFLKIDILLLKFRVVTGDFFVNNNLLTTLEGCPVEVGGDFYCQNNDLSTLEFSPKKVGRDFICYNNDLTSLMGCPTKVVEFSCYNNRLTSLVGCPIEVGRPVTCHNNKLPIEILDLFGSHCLYDKVAQEEQIIFLKYQSYFDVWSPEFNIEGFNELIAEIKDGLR